MFPAATLPPCEGVPARRQEAGVQLECLQRHLPAPHFLCESSKGAGGAQHLPLERLERPVGAQDASKGCHSSADQTFTEQLTPGKEEKPVCGHPMLGEDQYQGLSWRRSSPRAHIDMRCAATDHLNGQSPSIRTSISQCTPDSSKATWSSQERPEERFGVGSNQRGHRQQPACFSEQVFCSSERVSATQTAVNAPASSSPGIQAAEDIPF